MRKFSKIRSAIKTGASRFNDKLKNVKQNVKTQYDQEKQKVRSKRKSAILGFSTVISVFILKNAPAIAKEIPIQNPSKSVKKKPPIQQKKAPVQPSGIIVKQKFREAGSAFTGVICMAAFESGSYILGAMCGCAVVAGILITTGKK